MDIALYINDVRIKQKKVTKFLGIYIDSKFNWAEQIKYVLKKINRNIGILWKIRNSLNARAKKNYYISH